MVSECSAAALAAAPILLHREDAIEEKKIYHKLKLKNVELKLKIEKCWIKIEKCWINIEMLSKFINHMIMLKDKKNVILVKS